MQLVNGAQLLNVNCLFPLYYLCSAASTVAPIIVIAPFESMYASL